MIRTIYLYLFALLGLVLLIIGGVRFLDMGLKAFVFKKAEEEERLLYKTPYSMLYPVERMESLENDEELTEQEREAIKEWLGDYRQWKESQSQIDPVTTRRHRNASLNLAMILVGLPLYLYHWGTIKREIRKKEEVV